MLTCSLPPSSQSLAVSIPLSVEDEGGEEQPSLLLALPHRYDRAYHWGDFQLEWKAEDEEHFISVQANSSVLRVKGFGKGGAESRNLIVVAAKEYEGAADGSWALVTLRTVIVESSVGERARDRAVKIGAEVELEDFSCVEHVRWATAEEMNALSKTFYEQPTKLDKGDMYLPHIFKTRPFIYDDDVEWEEMTPRDDPFLFFSLWREALKQIKSDDYAEFMTVQYARCTEVLVDVEKEYPGNTSGKASVKSQEEAQDLRDALETAGMYITYHGLNPRGELPDLDAPSDLVFVDLPSQLAARLGLTVRRQVATIGSEEDAEDAKDTEDAKDRSAAEAASGAAQEADSWRPVRSLGVSAGERAGGRVGAGEE